MTDTKPQNSEMAGVRSTGPVSQWTQQGFCVVSKVIVEDDYLPILHGFYPAEWEAKAALEKLDELPAHLRVDAVLVKAEIRYVA